MARRGHGREAARLGQGAERREHGRADPIRAISAHSNVVSSRSSTPTPASRRIEKIGPYYYNFWRDAKNPRGLWRRTTLDEYKKAKPNWEIVLDLDALGKEEKTNWVWHGAQALKPDYKRALVSLSRGGADASVVREFDLTTKSFVNDGYTPARGQEPDRLARITIACLSGPTSARAR